MSQFYDELLIAAAYESGLRGIRKTNPFEPGCPEHDAWNDGEKERKEKANGN